MDDGGENSLTVVYFKPSVENKDKKVCVCVCVMTIFPLCVRLPHNFVCLFFVVVAVVVVVVFT